MRETKENHLPSTKYKTYEIELTAVKTRTITLLCSANKQMQSKKTKTQNPIT